MPTQKLFILDLDCHHKVSSDPKPAFLRYEFSFFTILNAKSRVLHLPEVVEPVMDFSRDFLTVK